MKIVFCFLSMLYLCNLSAQDTLTVWRYADLSYPLGGFSTKARVAVDYGETSGWFKSVELIEDDKGKAIRFKSPVDALNWMSQKGWDLIQSYQAEENAGITKLQYIHFIMRRREEYQSK